MGTLKIEFYDEAKVNGQNLNGKYLGGKEDATTSTTLETGNYVAGALVMSVTAIDKDHYFNPNSTAASTASNRVVILDGQTRDFEIPLVQRSTTKSYSYRSCT